ncbi:hypothetical protein BCR32DRAFT_266661 [Anaeromyces robustus]|uniref:SGNH hydrolase n=1 Tax=Anaeromyces robustus TaxID=1754192 RepID=A0A1Y1XES5_9FUNG|nr:hypothetical protein BCR32DRAFT_266661 [Anaeromyces robustus]|eukprot:ORX83936.1 hypothetical protein BCR32DRAFT_266661 [Anaeromyces robustus]
MNFINNILSFILLFIIVSIEATNVKEGHVSSLFFPSNKVDFNYFNITDLIVFGDSYSATYTNFETMKYTGKNASGGKDWPLHLLDLHDMYLWNFAWGGATMTNTYRVQSHRFALPAQFKLFEQRMTKGKEFSNWEGESSLFAIWFGINDMIKSTVSQEETVEIGHDVVFNLVAEGLYEYNARNFLFFNLPPMEIAPCMIKGGFSHIAEFVEKLNTSLKTKAEAFHKKHPDTNVMYYNTYDEFSYILENNQFFNVTYVKDEYYYHTKRDRRNFFWYDETHPTDYVQKYLTDDLDKFLTSHSVNITISNNKIDSNSNPDIIITNTPNTNSTINNDNGVAIKPRSKANLEESFGVKRSHYEIFCSTLISLLLGYIFFW